MIENQKLKLVKCKYTNLIYQYLNFFYKKKYELIIIFLIQIFYEYLRIKMWSLKGYKHKNY